MIKIVATPTYFSDLPEQDPNSVDPAKMEMAVAELDMITDVL